MWYSMAAHDQLMGEHRGASGLARPEPAKGRVDGFSEPLVGDPH